jgi:hypothetical protein
MGGKGNPSQPFAAHGEQVIRWTDFENRPFWTFLENHLSASRLQNAFGHL